MFSLTLVSPRSKILDKGLSASGLHGDPRKASQVRVRVRVRVSRRVRPGGVGSQFRVWQSEVTTVGNWDSVPPGNSGRLHGHALKYV